MNEHFEKVKTKKSIEYLLPANTFPQILASFNKWLFWEILKGVICIYDIKK